MTRFKMATLSPMVMSIMVAFCVAEYLEQSGIKTFSDDELKEFMSEISTDIEEWLRGEERTEEAIKYEEYDKAYDDYLALVNADINSRMIEPQESEE